MDKKLLALVKLRASQINGCAYCLHMHSEEARALGERDERMLLLDAWHESALYTEKERAALAWTEALTLLTEGVSDEVYAQARAEFSEKELAYLTSAIASINVWNRFGVAYRWTPPARQQGALDTTVRHTYEKAGTYDASFQVNSAQEACNNPYASSTVVKVTVVVTPSPT